MSDAGGSNIEVAQQLSDHRDAVADETQLQKKSGVTGSNRSTHCYLAM
jgi:hypothetical protein